MAYKLSKCYVCQTEGASQSHHLLPLEYGGPKNGPTVNLCPKCHLTCHYEAEIFYKEGEYLNLEENFKESSLVRVQEIINYVLKQKASFEDSGKPAQDARRNINLSLTADELLLVHAAKRVSKFTSVQRFVKMCIMERIKVLREQGKM